MNCKIRMIVWNVNVVCQMKFGKKESLARCHDILNENDFYNSTK